jgi:bifunctional UDP-N-acetylglucosamine pyrophosphorylase/glucosamine-1-phosphate N-acetyltransferase
MKNIAAIVLAAGKGKRMKSDLPKVLHPVMGRPMIEILLDTLISLGIQKIVTVIGFKADDVKTALKSYDHQISYAIQSEQLGTGHAVLMAEPELRDFAGDILVVAGDVPFLSSQTIASLIDTHQKEKAAATVLSSVPPDPTGYGRIIRKDGTNNVDYIIEHKDASETELQVGEINTGTFCFDNRYLFDALREIRADNSQKEYYLTDVMAILHRKGLKAAVHKTDNPDEALGINSLEQKADLEAKFAQKKQSY